MKKPSTYWHFLWIVASLISPSLLQATTIVNLFEENPTHIGKGDFVEDAVFFSLNKETLQKLHKANLQNLSLTIPFENGKELTLNLEKAPIMGSDFQVLVQKEDVNNKNYNIGKYEKGGDNSFVLYQEDNLNFPNPFHCSTEEPEFITMEQQSSSRSNANKKVGVYIECDHHLYKNMGSSTTRVMDFTTGLFNIVSTLYQQESITLEISEIKIWSTPDPYVTSSAKSARNDFATTLNGNFKGDIAHLLSNYKVNGTPPNGGSANIDVLCNKAKAVGYTNITTSYLSFPTFSWTAYAVTHEIGHNLGSPHTHSCLWPTGPIDNCWCPEGGCAIGPEPTSSGTMMSYCHLNPNWTNACELSNSNPGIDFTEGFGKQPGDLIRAKVEAASCLQSSTPAVSSPVVSAPAVNISVEPADESCAGSRDGSIQVAVQSGQAPYTYRWNTGASSSRLSNLPPANYSVTVTDQNGTTASATGTIKSGTVIQINAGSDKVLSCNAQEVVLDARNSTEGSQFRTVWTKQEGTIANSIIGNATNSILRVTEPGTYIYTITHLATGCSATDRVVVTRESADATVQITNGQLTCNQPSTQLVATTGTTGTYQWIGPNGFTSSQINPVVNQPGLYQLLFNNEAGCSSTGFARVESTVSVPQVFALGGTLDCATTALQLQGSSDEQGTYQWTGPDGFVSTQQNPEASISGIYTLVFRNSNGCTNTAVAEVRQSIEMPTVDVQGGTISCTKSATPLQVQSNTNNLRYSWVGPNGFTSNQQNPTVNEAGTYTLTATANNGCSTSKSAVVIASREQPVFSIQAAALDCNNSSTYLEIITSATLNAYRWSGPEGFNSTIQRPLVNQAGTYTLTVWGTNGCSATATYELETQGNSPNFTLAAAPITCNSPSTVLEVNLINNDYSYRWTGPNDFTSTTIQPTVNLVGTYTLTLIHANGCSASKSITVAGAVAMPIAELAATNMSCDTETAQLFGRAGNSTDRLIWRGPNGFNSAQANPRVQTAGIYELTVVGANGCSVTESIEVKNEAVEVKKLLVTDESCGNNDGSIRIEMADPTATYTVQWNTGHTGLNLPFVPAGNYSAIIESSTGCSTTVNATVKPASDIRLLTTEIRRISCYNANDGFISVSLTGGLAPYNLLWSNGMEGGINSQLSPGTHSLEVEDARGCVRIFYFEMKNPEPVEVLTEIGDR